jgi:hypothetical protein
MEKRKCKLCKSPFTGRIDKIFCSPVCKATYHRKLLAATLKATFSTDKILHRNRSILFEVLVENLHQKKVNRNFLTKKNFRFEYMTGFYENSQGKRYPLVYDFAWMKFKTGDILVVRRKKID